MASADTSPEAFVRPRDVANKSKKENLEKAIAMALAIESEPVRRNTGTFNQNRYKAVRTIEDYEALKDRARAIKERAIEQIESSLDVLKKAVEARGGHFFLTQNATEASHLIRDICRRHNAHLVVKSKSITSEEIRLNPVLQEAGIEVAETDLAEFILQVSDEQPSHIVAPAIHRSRERISKLFKEKFRLDEALETGEDLTKFARDILRQKFLTADVGITGANVIAAETGTLILVENEGNIRMVTQAPSVHIAVAGVEKVVPKFEDVLPFVELLAPSGTGQPLSQYTHFLNPPIPVRSFSFDGRAPQKRAFYLILVDNGRFKMREDPVLKEALYCVRCSACMNVCPVFQVVGGHAFGGETYPGGIGGAWEAGTGTLSNARFSELCTGCSRCVPQCPVRIDIPWMNSVLHDRLNQLDASTFFWGKLLGSSGRDAAAPLQKQFFGNYANFVKLGSTFSPLSNKLAATKGVARLLESVGGMSRYRKPPAFRKNTLQKQFQQWTKKRGSLPQKANHTAVVVFSDIYTNYLHPESGMATVRVLQALGVPVLLSPVIPEGRAALSQGMIETATKRALRVAEYLSKEIDHGHPVVVPEPSVLALFRRDYKNLLADSELFKKIRTHSFGAAEYVARLLEETQANPREWFRAELCDLGSRIFLHGHCQRKSLKASLEVADIFKQAGFDVVQSDVECCGMAGSFGYKKQFYAISMRIGEELFRQIRKADGSAPRILVASGISCRHQIEDGARRHVYHPLEILEKSLVKRESHQMAN